LPLKSKAEKLNGESKYVHNSISESLARGLLARVWRCQVNFLVDAAFEFQDGDFNDAFNDFAPDFFTGGQVLVRVSTVIR
jgi:hypothetical protein